MKRVIHPVYGILQDLPQPFLPSETVRSGRGFVEQKVAISGGVNVVVRDETLSKSAGYESVYGTPQVAPLWVLPVIRSTTDHFWLYAGTGKVYVVDESNTHTEITNAGGDFTGSASDGWTGDVFGNRPVMSNGVDVPQEWTVGTGNNLVDLSNWETDVASGATCKILRSFGQFMVAMNTTEGVNSYPNRVRWSDKGSIGSMPGWDASGSNEAGSVDLLRSYGPITDGLELRDRFIVYKGSETFVMSLIGGQEVMSFRLLSQTSGALAKNCAGEFRNTHFVLTESDVVAHDGNTVRSIIDKANRRYLFNQIDPVNFDRSFLVVNKPREEIWVCFPQDGESSCTLAAVFSLQNKTWGFIELPGVTHASLGKIEQTQGSWDSDSGSWDSDDTRWDETEYNPARARMVWAGFSNTKLYEADKGNTADGTAFRANASQESDPFGDTDEVIRVERVRPIVEALNGTVLTVRVGGQYDIADAIDYTEYSFTVGTDEQVDVRVDGKYISWEIETESDVAWDLLRLEFEYTPQGTR